MFLCSFARYADVTDCSLDGVPVSSEKWRATYWRHREKVFYTHIDSIDATLECSVMYVQMHHYIIRDTAAVQGTLVASQIITINST